MLKVFRHRIARLVVAAVLSVAVLGQPIVSVPYATLPVYASECPIVGGSNCGG
jgi:hypothetical protein